MLLMTCPYTHRVTSLRFYQQKTAIILSSTTGQGSEINCLWVTCPLIGHLYYTHSFQGLGLILGEVAGKVWEPEVVGTRTETEFSGQQMLYI